MRFIAVLIAVLLIPVSAFASAEDVEYLSLKAARMSCTIDFHVALLQKVSEKNDSPEIPALIEKLNADKAELNIIAEKGSHKEFQLFLNRNIKPSARISDDAMKSSFSGMSSNDKASLKVSYGELKTGFVECKRLENLKLAKKRLNFYSNVLRRSSSEAVRLEDKGIDVSEMNIVIAGAQTSVIAPLNETLRGESGRAEKAVKTYCLWSGCKEGSNYYFAEKFAVAKLSAIASKVGQDNPQGISSVQNHNAIARSLIQSLGTAHYTQEQKEQIWLHIRTAEKELKALIEESS